MDEEKMKDVEKKENTSAEVSQEVEKEVKEKAKKEKKSKEVKEGNAGEASKKKKIILFSSIGAVALLVLVIIIAIICMSGKPSKKDAQKIVKSYLNAMTDNDGEALTKIIDTEGYIIYNEEGEKKFNEKYKDKSKYIKKYLDKNDYDNIKEAQEDIADKFESTNKYQSYEYSLKEITKIEKSKKSNKIVIIKAKVKVSLKSTLFGDKIDVKTLRLYTTKVNGKFKIIGAEFV